MKWVIFLTFLVQRNCISSQPTNEMVRENRQLNFEECCPCPTVDRIKDNNVLGTRNAPSDCLCRLADAETASSIFTPTSKAAQSFDRPFKNKDEPKPLLNPEVGLASSVLETLRDVTDVEYQEALAREVARSALRDMDADAEEMPTSANRNIFNNILNPRHKEEIDAIPEASHNAETSFIHPTFNRINELRHIEIQPQRNLLKDFLLSKPANLHKNIFDVDNSPNDIKENISPSKNNLLDDIKIKTNLLKSKLFPNNKGLLQRMATAKSFGNPLKKKSDWKLDASLDNVKSKFDSNSLPPVAEKTKDLSLLSNNIFKNNEQNNKKVVLIPLRKAQKSNKYIPSEVLSSEAINFPMPKDMQRVKNTKNHDTDSNADTSILSPVLSPRDDCNLRTENTKKIHHTNVIDSSTSNLPVFIPPHKSTEILDTIPSPSEIIDEDNRLTDPGNKPHEDSNDENLSEINIEPNLEQITNNIHEDSNPTSIAISTDIQENTSNLSIEENNDEADKYNPEIVCTTENSKPEIDSFYIVSTPEPLTTPTTDVFNSPLTQNEQENINSMNAEGSSQSNNNLLDKNKYKNIKILPNISEDIKKTFENVKNMNEKWQEKIKLDVQEALQLINGKKDVIVQENLKQNPEFMPNTLDIHPRSNGRTSNNLSTHELQKMSDSILTLSSVNQNPNSSVNHSVKEVSDTLQEMDSNGEPSETISCFTPAEVYSSKKSEEKRLNNNNKVSEYQNNFPNLNTGEIYRDIKDKSRKSEIPLEKFSITIKEPRSDIFDKNEMAAEASEPKPQRNNKIVLDNLRYSKQDSVVEPNKDFDHLGSSLLNVNNFFDNVIATISNVFRGQNGNIFRQIEDNEDKMDNNYNKNRQDRHFDLEKPTFSLKKNANGLKSAVAIPSDTYSIDRYQPNLNPYRARIAVPDSFDVKPILTRDETVDKKSRTLNNPRNKLPKPYLTNTFVYNSNENLGNKNLGSLLRESDHNNPNSESTVLSPNILQKNFKSSGLKNRDSVRDRTEEALQNIHKTVGNPLRSSFKENNRFLNKNIDNDNFFETVASRRHELNERLQAINLDLNDRLSTLSQRMADSILPSLNSQLLSQRRMTAKSRSDVRNKQGLDSLRRINVPSNIRSASPKRKLNTHLIESDERFSVPKLLQKSLISDHLSNLKSVRLRENSMSQRSTPVKPALKSSPVIKSPKTETKTYKPKYKDNKMIPVTATDRPKIEISGLKPPKSIKKVSTLTPKIPTPSVEKKPFISRLKFGEPHSLGSENIMSRVLLDKKKESDKFATDVSSDESDQTLDSDFKDVKAANQEVARKFVLSKLREAFKAKILNRNSNDEEIKDNNFKSSANADVEIRPSASHNVNRAVEGSLRENVQYKCKMLCTRDK